MKDTCFNKLVKVARKLVINLFVSSDNEPIRVSLEGREMSKSEIN